MNSFLNSLTVESNKTLTENGAVTNTSTFDSVLDFFYHAPAKRGQDEELNRLFFKALSENDKLATKALFYVRDIRGGQGERSTFRLGLAMLKKERPSIFKAILPLIAEYGRWDDLISFVDDADVQNVVWQQLKQDLEYMEDNKPISLLGKWMPSINTSSKATVALARKWAKVWNVSEKKYRQTLSSLRVYINIVERTMSNNAWGQIDYSAVPSRANLIYKEAFKKHDGERYNEFIDKAVKGEVKINSGTLYPSDIVSKYIPGNMDATDDSLEALWNNLPDYANTMKNALVVADTSGSMFVCKGATSPITVCLALAIYIAERNTGIFNNKFITFSETPELQSLIGVSLREKLANLAASPWGFGTNLQAAFDLLLHAAIKGSCKQEELPEALFIVSDMEFDCCSPESTNFELIKQKFETAGYVVPKLVFWNVDSKGNQTPVTKDEHGVYLVSGYSPSIFEKAINSTCVTPMEMMLETLNCSRYEALDKVLETV